MMKKMIIILTAALGLTMTAHAKIGDSFDTLVKTYGRPSWSQPLQNGSGSRTFWVNHNWLIEGFLDSDGVCQAVYYIKGNGYITHSEAQRLDKANVTVAVPKWKTIPQDSSDSFTGGIGYVSTGTLFFEITEGSYLFGNKWYSGRSYATQAGLYLAVGNLTQSMTDLPADVSL
jgi:hypothetical protein